MITFIANYVDSNGILHTTTAQYDNLTGMVTYASDYIGCK